MTAVTMEQRLAAEVRRHSPTPLHHQIKVAVLQGIEQGWLRPGTQLPRERRLAEALGVSLAPVRQAMLDLTKEGYVDRTRGKGTFVRERKLIEKIQILGSFHGSMRQQGLDPVVRVLSSTIERASDQVAEALQFSGRRRVWSLRRLAILEDIPVALLSAWLPASYQKGMSSRDFGEGSLYEALAEVHGVEMTSADNLVEVGRAGLDDADLLQLTPGSPLLEVSGVTRDQREQPVEYSRVLYRPEHFRFAIESRRGENNH
ncbi:MAG: GntR family transcriptional regulator [Nocardioides sp.]|nr:GntR family transcriptional regulator [Nocardioides sp.]